jgi:hypothetical protein
MYAERRIIEALEGEEMSTLQAALGRRELDESLERFADQPQMTKLRPHLVGVDPDECYSLIPYEKGYLFLLEIEHAVGREAFAAWLRTYLHAFRFGAITTEDFEAHIEKALPGALAKANARAWIDGEGLPPTAHVLKSARVDAIEALKTTVVTRAQVAAWTPIDWALYLESVPRPAPHAQCSALDELHALTKSTNYDVLVPWLTLALKSGYTAVLPRVDEVLGAVGRMKYLRPLYTALPVDDARAIYAKHAASYHPIARQMVEGVFAKR